MKKIIITIILIIAFSVLMYFVSKNNNEEISDNLEMNNNIENIDNKESNIEGINIVEKKQENIENNTINENKVEDMGRIYIKVNNQILDVELEDNSATKELKEKLKNGDIVIEAHEYGGFEKIGDLGFLLPREDVNVTTTAGDIVLYQGNQISIFYNSNSWSYTKLGKIQNITSNQLKTILGAGDVSITFTLSR